MQHCIVTVCLDIISNYEPSNDCYIRDILVTILSSLKLYINTGILFYLNRKLSNLLLKGINSSLREDYNLEDTSTELINYDIYCYLFNIQLLSIALSKVLFSLTFGYGKKKTWKEKSILLIT